jgi:hypothetical protein
LSFCSVDTNFLPYFSASDYSSLKIKLPNIVKIFDQSVLFTNSYTDYSWSTARRFIYLDSWRKKYGIQNKWQSPVQDWEQDSVKATIIRIPMREDFINQYNDFYNDDRLTEPFNKVDEVFQQIKSRKEKYNSPNFWMVHFKLMHYPYLSETYLNNQQLLSKTFTKIELDLIKIYLSNPTQFPDKYPFFQILFGDQKIKKLFLNKQGQYVSYLASEESIKRWKKSTNYLIDLNILKKSYQLRLVDLDRLIGELFQKYKHIEEDTVLVFGGDHGETVLEHDYLSHGYIPYDEVIRFFHAIHFPKQTKKITVDTQYSQATLGAMIENINLGKIDFQSFFQKPTTKLNNDSVISYSCAGDVVSFRDPSGWKYVLFLNDQKEYLFNTKSDPKEIKNIATIFPNIASKYKTEINNQLAFKQLFNDTCIK